jgi:hypothetical protein
VVLATSFLGLLVAAGGATGARGASTGGWALYSGRYDGVRVVFELKGPRLIPALVSVPVACVGGGRPHRRFEELRSTPIRVDRPGRFDDRVERNDSFEFESEKLVGRVTPRSIEGTIAVEFITPVRVGNEECHSGEHPHGRVEELSFRAYRHRRGA